MWQKALLSGAEWISITSFNECHEGTQIEPATIPATQESGFRYFSYEGAYGLRGDRAPFAYLDRTHYWVQKFTEKYNPERTVCGRILTGWDFEEAAHCSDWCGEYTVTRDFQNVYYVLPGFDPQTISWTTNWLVAGRRN
jgi:glycosyl hydrolase family 99